MRPDTTLTLGAFAFAAYEIPEEIPTGGEQILVRHQQVGGTRVVDAMGRSDAPIGWSGLFLGASAVDRSRYLDALRISGKPQILSWSQYRYSVVVREYSGNFRRQFEIPYRIVCEVLSDLTAPSTQNGTAPIDTAVGDDYIAAFGLSQLVGDTQLTQLIANVGVALKVVATFANASRASVNGVLQPIATAQQRVNQLLAISNSSIAGALGFSGVQTYAPAAKVITAFSGQVVTMQQLNSLVQMKGTLGRMSANLGGIDASESSVGVAGGNLFKIAADQYGDATAWTTIARANGIADPFVSGTQVLAVPPTPDTAGGVLDA